MYTVPTVYFLEYKVIYDGQNTNCKNLSIFLEYKRISVHINNNSLSSWI